MKQKACYRLIWWRYFRFSSIYLSSICGHPHFADVLPVVDAARFTVRRRAYRRFIGNLLFHRGSTASATTVLWAAPDAVRGLLFAFSQCKCLSMTPLHLIAL
jgi:hypothetical protein